jgi:multidrug transporter EmrE-like cation transporter
MKGNEMNSAKIAGMILLVAGVLGLMYGGFSYTKDTQQAKIGPITLVTSEKQTVNVPVWLGIGAIAVGGLIFLFGNKKA